MSIRQKINHLWSPLVVPAPAPLREGDPSVSSTTDLFALAPGQYVVRNVVIARALKLPRDRPGTITVDSIGAARVLTYVSFEEGSQPALEFRKQLTIRGVEQPWVSSVGSSGSSNSGGAGPARRAFLQQQLTARKGGRIGTGGRGVIALRFDDAPDDFKDTVLPMLVQRGLPFTRVSTSVSIGKTTIPAGTFDAMQEYSIRCGGEVWAHGSDHLDASGEPAIHANLVGSLSDLRTAMPRIPVDCFAPAGGSSINYDGHMPSHSLANWSDTYAGRLLLDHFAIASGYFKDTYFRPLDGILRDGQIHYSSDARSVASTPRLVAQARDWQMGVVMMWHSNNFGVGGNMSISEFAGVLDHIVAQRDAGNILVLTKSGLCLADIASAHRDDILPSDSGNPFTVSIPSPQYRQNIPGSTRELTATVAGIEGRIRTSVIGEASRMHTIPNGGTLYLRHVATIPLDSTSLTVSINANTTGAKLLAV